MARNNLLSRRETGTTLWLWAVSRGRSSHDFGQDVDAGDVDGRDVKHAAHGDGEVLFAHVGFFDDEFDQARAALLLLLEQFLHLDGAQQAVLDEGVGDAFSE